MDRECEREIMGTKNKTTVAVFVSGLALVGLATSIWAQTSEPAGQAAAMGGLSQEDDQAVHKIIAVYEEAWNAHDMQAIANLFRGDAQWVNKVGMHWRGRDEIMIAHTAFHETIFKDHSYQTDAVETRSVAPGVAVAVVSTTFEGFLAPDGRAWPKTQNRLTYVLVKGADGWKIAHGQNSEVDAIAVPHDPVQKRRK